MIGLVAASRRRFSRSTSGVTSSGYAATCCLAIEAAVARGCVVVIDGYVVTAALLVAWRRDPRVRSGCVFAHLSAEPGHRHALAALEGRPLLDLGLRLGEGSGAALAMPLLRAAARMLTEMASFEQAGVSRATGA